MSWPTYINIIIILLSIILIMSTKQTQAINSSSSMENDEWYKNFTAVEFLKGLQSFKENNGNILILHNQNTTIASVFYTNAVTKFNENSKNTTATRASLLSENLTGTSSTLTFVGHLMQRMQVPVVLLNELQSFYLKRHLGEHLLSIVYIDINIEGIQNTLNDHKALLQKWPLNLLHITATKVLLLLNFPPLALQAVGNESLIEGVLLQLFQYCWQQRIINVVALLADYQTTMNFYSYTHFPEFQLEKKTIAQSPEEQEEIYPYRLGNLLNYKLPIIIGGSDPRIIPLKLSTGQLMIGGFVGHFMEAFAKKFNCTLTQPLPYRPRSPIPAVDAVKAVRNGTVEISAALKYLHVPISGYTYPYEQMNWCLVLPVEPAMPDYAFFTLVFRRETFLSVIASLVVISMLLSAALYFHGYRPDILDIICHGDCLRGILGQAFAEIANPPTIVRFIYLKICILGIVLTTAYNSYYSTYVITPPREAPLNDFDDILLSGLKVVAWEPEYTELVERVTEFRKYTDIFLVEKNYQKYLEMRESFNTKFGYAMSTIKWTIFHEQQKIFTTPLFRFSPKFCIFNNIPMCFPVHENSIFSPLVYQLILETAQSGLTNHWSRYAYLELILADKLRLVDSSKRQKFQAMKVDDFYYIFIFMGSMLILVILVFLGELFVFNRKFIIRRIKRCYGGRVHRRN